MALDWLLAWANVCKRHLGTPGLFLCDCLLADTRKPLWILGDVIIWWVVGTRLSRSWIPDTETVRSDVFVSCCHVWGYTLLHGNSYKCVYVERLSLLGCMLKYSWVKCHDGNKWLLNIFKNIFGDFFNEDRWILIPASTFHLLQYHMSCSLWKILLCTHKRMKMEKPKWFKIIIKIFLKA